MISAKQSGCQDGDVSFTADGAITEGYVVKISSPSTAGVPRVTLPTAVSDITPFVALNTAADGEVVWCRPLDGSRSVNLVSDGIIVGGVHVFLSSTYGKVVTSTGAGSATYHSPGFAEKTSASGGLVRIRPVPRQVVV